MASTLVSSLGSDLAREIITLGLETIPGQMLAAKTASERADLTELARLAHQMSGGAGALGLAKLAASCIEIENTALSGKRAEIPLLVTALEVQTKTALSDLSLLLQSLD